MNILDGRQVLRKTQVAKQGVIVEQALQVTKVGMVGSIADAILNKDTIKSRKILDSAFSKLYAVTKDIQKGNKGNVDLTDDEKSVFSEIGDVVKKGAWVAVKEISGKLFSSFFQAVRLAIVPVFRIFTMVVGTVFRMILSNPYTLAAAALIGAALGGYAYYRRRDAEYRGERTINLPGTTETRPEAGLSVEAEKNPVKKAIIEAAKRNKVPADLALSISFAESGWKPSAASGTGGTAKGLFGVINSVWKDYGGTPEQRSDVATDADIGTRIIAANAKNLKRVLGREPTYGEVYTAHYFGPSVAHALKEVNPNDPVEKWLARFQNEKQVKNIMALNPNLRNKTVGDILATIDKKMGVGSKSWAVGLAQNEISDSKPIAGASGVATGSFIIPAAGVYVSAFGPRTLTVNGKTATGDHQGIDIAGPLGSPIYAADGGRVVDSIWPAIQGGYGTKIVIDHGNGFQTLYGHSKKLLVNKGDTVYKGQKIAEMGSEGRSTGSHLHFEIQKVVGKSTTPVDPASYLPGFPQTKNTAISESQVRQSAAIEKEYIKVGKNFVELK